MDNSATLCAQESNDRLVNLPRFGFLDQILPLIASHLRRGRVPLQDREDVRQEV